MNKDFGSLKNQSLKRKFKTSLFELPKSKNIPENVIIGQIIIVAI